MMKFTQLLQQYIDNFQNLEIAFTILVALIAFLESFAIIGYIMPGTILLYGAAAFAFRQNMTPHFLGAAIIAGFIADIISYYLGQNGNAFIMKHTKRYESLLQKTHAFFERYGALAIIIGKISGTLRPLISLVAGTSKMSPKKFLILVWIGNIITSALYLIIIYYFKKYAFRIHGGMLTLGLVIIFIALAYVILQQNSRPSSHPDLSD